MQTQRRDHQAEHRAAEADVNSALDSSEVTGDFDEKRQYRVSADSSCHLQKQRSDYDFTKQIKKDVGFK